MTVLRRYFAGEIYRSVAFVLIAFLALFAFLDMMSEIKSVGQGGYRVEHAFIYVSLGLPNYAYQIMPIAALIGTIYVMAQFAARSEFTVMRASSLSMAGVIRMLLPIAIAFAVLTFVLGEFIAPRFNDFRENAKRRIQGATISSEFRSGLWAKDVLRDPVTKQITGSRFLNAGKVELSGELRSVWVYEVDNQMRLMTLITAEEAHFLDNNRWRLDRVKEMRFVRDAGQTNSGQSAIITQYKFYSSILESEITPEIMAVLISDPDRMSALDLIVFTKHLKENRQRTDRYDIALWKKLLYPLAVFVMMSLALPFAYLQSRSGGLSLKIFIGIMIGVSFQLLNSLFSHIGLLNTWPPFMTAIVPSALFLFAAISACRWVERH
jgi:lipopolysaccharide export system permease protein